jgi:hypothetical protein
LASIGVLTLVLATQARASFQEPGKSTVQSLLDASLLNVIASFFTQPMAGLLVVLVSGGLIAFADATRVWTRLAVGLAHATVQLGGTAIAIWASFMAIRMLPGLTAEQEPCLLVKTLVLIMVGAMIFALGAFIGGLVMGCYLYVAQLLDAHANEAYAALRLERSKCFLRMKLSKEGLELFPLGIDQPCRGWQPNQSGALAPTEGIEPKLIDSPISIRTSSSARR